jgi:hypothetical protein
MTPGLANSIENASNECVLAGQQGTLREFIAAQPSLFTKECKATPTVGASTVVCGFNTGMGSGVASELEPSQHLFLRSVSTSPVWVDMHAMAILNT